MILQRFRRLQQDTMPPDTNDQFHLLDLPAELRNRIYRYAVVPTGSCPILSSVREGINTSLLRTCRQVHQEATAILYEETTFVARGTEDELSVFLFRHGFQTGLLRRIEFTEPGSGMELLENHIRLLSESPLGELRSLCIGWRVRYQFKKPEKMVQLLLPLLQALHEDRKGTDRKQAMDVLEFPPLHMDGLSPERKEKLKSAAREFSEQVREILKEVLK